MRLIRMLGLAVVTAAAATALLGAGSASATSLCQEEANPCPEGAQYPMGSSFILDVEGGAAAQFEGPGVECKASAMVDVLVSGFNPLIDEVTAWSFSQCSVGGSACSVSVSTLPLKSEISYSAGPNGVMVVASAGGGNPRVVIECTLFTCTYGAEKIEFDLVGGKPAQLVASKEPLIREGGGLFCPATTVFSAQYLFEQVEIEGSTTNEPPVFVSE